jgi:hypothetical protein
MTGTGDAGAFRTRGGAFLLPLALPGTVNRRPN